MKRIIAIMLSVLMILSVTSCAKKAEVEDQNGAAKENISNQENKKEYSIAKKQAEPSEKALEKSAPSAKFSGAQSISHAGDIPKKKATQEEIDAYNKMMKERLGYKSEGYYNENNELVFIKPNQSDNQHYYVYETLENIYLDSDFVATAKLVKIDKFKVENTLENDGEYYKFVFEPINVYRGKANKKYVASVFLVSTYDSDPHITKLDVGDTTLLFLHSYSNAENIYTVGEASEPDIDVRSFSSIWQNFLVNKDGKLKKAEKPFDGCTTIVQAENKLLDMMKTSLNK